MFDFLSKNKIKCERCGSKDNIAEEKIFAIFRTRLCAKCWRIWEYQLMDNKDFMAMLKLASKWQNASDKEKEEIGLFNRELAKELYPLLEAWISQKG